MKIFKITFTSDSKNTVTTLITYTNNDTENI